MHGNRSEADVVAHGWDVRCIYRSCDEDIYNTLTPVDAVSTPFAKVYAWSYSSLWLSLLNTAGLGRQTRARSAASQYHDACEEVPLGSSADREEQAHHHGLLKHKDAFARSPDLR